MIAPIAFSRTGTADILKFTGYVDRDRLAVYILTEKYCALSRLIGHNPGFTARPDIPHGAGVADGKFTAYEQSRWASADVVPVSRDPACGPRRPDQLRRHQSTSLPTLELINHCVEYRRAQTRAMTLGCVGANRKRTFALQHPCPKVRTCSSILPSSRIPATTRHGPKRGL